MLRTMLALLPFLLPGQQSTLASATPEPGLSFGDAVLTLQLPEETALALIPDRYEVLKVNTRWELSLLGRPAGALEVENRRITGVAVLWDDSIPAPSSAMIVDQLALALGSRSCSASMSQRTFEGERQRRVVFDCGVTVVTLHTSVIGELVRTSINVRRASQ